MLVIYYIYIMNIRDIDLNLLVIFNALIQDLNVSRAAIRVGLSQSAMSNALNRLRETFEDPLFTRTARGMVATQRARDLEVPIREALTALEGAFSAGNVFDPKTAKHLFSIATTDYVEYVLIPNLTHRFISEAPGVRLEVLPLKEKTPYKDLEEGKIDAAIGYFTDLQGDVFQKELYSEEFVCMVSKKSPLKDKMTVNQFAELKHVIVAPWGGMTGLVDSVLEQQKKARAVVVSTPYFLVAPAIVAKTDYAVTMPRKLAETIAPLFGLKILKHPLELQKMTINLLWHERTHKDARAKWFRESVVKSLTN